MLFRTVVSSDLVSISETHSSLTFTNRFEQMWKVQEYVAVHVKFFLNTLVQEEVAYTLMPEYHGYKSGYTLNARTCFYMAAQQAYSHQNRHLQDLSTSWSTLVYTEFSLLQLQGKYLAMCKIFSTFILWCIHADLLCIEHFFCLTSLFHLQKCEGLIAFQMHTYLAKYWAKKKKLMAFINIWFLQKHSAVHLHRTS